MAWRSIPRGLKSSTLFGGCAMCNEFKLISLANHRHWQERSYEENTRHVSYLHRKPVKVYEPGEPVPPFTKSQKEAMSRAVKEAEKREEIANPRKDNFIEVVSEANKSNSSKNIVVEGERLIEEAFKNGLELRYLYLQDTLKKVPTRIETEVRSSGVQVETVSSKLMKKWSSLITPPGVLGIFKKPNFKTDADGYVVPLTVICDNFREPGNLGSVFRSAAGVGCKRVLLTKGCVNPWEGKVLRGGMGAQFRIPIEINFNALEFTNRILADCESYNSHRKEAPTDHDDHRIIEDVSETVLPSVGIFLADNKDTESDERKSIPLMAYTDVAYGNFDNIYLVVGGETEGLSRSILQAASSLKGAHPHFKDAVTARLQIPLFYGMESLNSSHAFSVISYEILRQWKIKQK